MPLMFVTVVVSQVPSFTFSGSARTTLPAAVKTTTITTSAARVFMTPPKALAWRRLHEVHASPSSPLLDRHGPRGAESLHEQDPLHPRHPPSPRAGGPLHRAPVPLRGAGRDARLRARARGRRARGGEDARHGG